MPVHFNQSGLKTQLFKESYHIADLGIWFKGEYGCAGPTVGLGDLEALFQH